MSEKKRKDQVLGVEPSGYIHPDNARRLLDGETVAFRKKPYGHDGGGIPVFVGHSPVSAEPMGMVEQTKLHIKEIDALNQEIALLDEQIKGTVWRWQNDGRDHIESMGNNMGVLIRACDLRELIAAQAQPEDDSIAMDRLADYIADTWPMDKKYGLEEICQRLHAMWPGEFMPAVQVDKSPETQGKPVDESPDLQDQQQPVSGADGATERALAELVDKIMPGLDTGDLLADAATASKALDRDQPSGNAGELDERELFSKACFYKSESPAVGLMCGQDAAWWGWQARAELAQQDADKAALDEWDEKTKFVQEMMGKGELPVKYLGWHRADVMRDLIEKQDAGKADAALAEMVHAMFRSGNSVPVARITIDRKQYDAAIDAGDVAR